MIDERGTWGILKLFSLSVRNALRETYGNGCVLCLPLPQVVVNVRASESWSSS
jgi:hypothetical protein